MIPSGTVTFLFTDIEGSTKLWQQFPNAMPTALARHHDILRDAIEAQNGYVFQIIGDAFCAAFVTAFDGLDAALDAQRALRDFAWGETGALRVRMALHTGAVELRAGEFTSGEYVSGITLSRAARLLSAGHGGQILLSAPTAELVREQLPRNTALRDMGAHRLKDLVQPQQIFQILAPDLLQDFPALKTLDALPNNLPIQLTSFVGREREIREIKELLTKDERRKTDEQSTLRPSTFVVRLLTLTGAGGSGKTRLSLQVAAEGIDEFEKGAWFVELAPIADASLVPNAVMSALELREEAGRALLDALTDFLRAKKLLLILDNCEHLVEACAQLAHHLLTHCPNLKILATSREALGVAGEVTYAVPPLGLPSADEGRKTNDEEYAARIGQYDAVKLFIERATAVQPNFAVTNANAPAIAQICYRLDGIPLAIELAAARIKLFSPEQVAARLDDRFRLLTSGSRNVMPRQQTLRAAIDWSYSLLSEQERILFRRLSVFVGGWTFEAAEQVCAGNGIDEFEILELLAHLVDKSLVTTELRGDETRYRMLETIREYAREKMREAGELKRVWTRQLAYLVDFAEMAERHLNDAEQLVWLERLESEHTNFQAALGWVIETDEQSINQSLYEAGLRLAGAIGDFWWRRGYLQLGQRLYQQLLGYRCDSVSPVILAKALSWSGFLAAELGNDTIGRQLLDEGVELYRKTSDKVGLAYALILRGVVALHQGDFAARKLGDEESLALFRESGDLAGVARALRASGFNARMRGDQTSALAFFQEGLVLSRQIGDPFQTALILRHLGLIAKEEADLARARGLLEESLSEHRKLGNKPQIPILLMDLGFVAEKQGDYELAKRYLYEGIPLSYELGQRHKILEYLLAIADLARAQGNPTRAARLLGAIAAFLNLRIPMHSDDRAKYARVQSDVRLSLYDKYAVEFAKGQNLTMEQAIELALRGD